MSKLVENILKEAEIDLVAFSNKLNALKAEYISKGFELDISYRQAQSVQLEKIIVPKDNRNQGLGSEFMRKLCELCDDYNVILTCSPSVDFGSTMTRLLKFYKSFGFISNKGRKADHRFWCGMIRYPKTTI